MLRLFQNTTSQVLELGFDEASTVFVTIFQELSIPSSCKGPVRIQVPSTSCAQERPDSDTPQGAPGPQPTPLRLSYPRSHMGRSRAMVLWKIKKRTKTRGGQGEGTREGGDGQEKTMKYHARSETGNKDQGDKVYPSGCSNTPTTAALGTSTTGFSQPTPLARQGQTPNSCDQFGNHPLIRTAKLSLKPLML